MTPPCRFLRARSLTAAFRTEAERYAAMASSTTPFSCLRTCASWGPDGSLCAPEGCCDAARPCYTPAAPLPTAPRAQEPVS